MALTPTQLAALKASVQTVADEINALVPDPLVNPLQSELDAAHAVIEAMQARIGAAKAKLVEAAAADAVEDAGRAGALAELG